MNQRSKLAAAAAGGAAAADGEVREAPVGGAQAGAGGRDFRGAERADPD